MSRCTKISCSICGRPMAEHSGLSLSCPPPRESVSECRHGYEPDCCTQTIPWPRDALAVQGRRHPRPRVKGMTMDDLVRFGDWWDKAIQQALRALHAAVEREADASREKDPKRRGPGEAMTPEERAQALVDECALHKDFTLADSSKLVGVVCELHLADAIRAAVAEEREACCAALCGHCERGLPLISNEEHRQPEPYRGLETRWLCKAAAIRARGSKA